MGASRAFKNDYREFIRDYVLRIIGETKSKVVFINEEKEDSSFDSFSCERKEGNVTLNFGIIKRVYLSANVNFEPDEDDQKLVKIIIKEFLKMLEYDDEGNPQYKYISESIKNKNYKYAIERGISIWIAGDAKNADSIEKLFGVLEKWSLKTYEGRKVSYAIVINNKAPIVENDFSKYGSFVEFLDDDFSAVLTDPISSIFELDSSCNYLGYRTVLEENDGKLYDYKLINNLPYRFANLIYNFVDDSKKIGVFLLNNGDIIISKKQEIRFVKRNGEWLNFNIRAFNNAIYDYKNKNKISDSLINEIYSSTLDVSFSHVGGIIALVDNVESLIEGNVNNPEQILNKCDYISSLESKEELENYMINQNKMNPNKMNDTELKRDISKKILKREIMRKSLNYQYIFGDINRKLRCELIYMRKIVI